MEHLNDGRFKTFHRCVVKRLHLQSGHNRCLCDHRDQAIKAIIVPVRLNVRGYALFIAALARKKDLHGQPRLNLHSVQGHVKRSSVGFGCIITTHRTNSDAKLSFIAIQVFSRSIP